MTRARYRTEVKIFAINERAERKQWNVIRREITERFGVPPPTVRAMENWQKTIDRDSIAAELMKDVKQEGPKIQAQAQVAVGQSLLPTLVAARAAGEDTETAAWMWFFSWIEGWLGAARLEHMMREYLRRKGASGGDPKESSDR